MFNGDGSVGEAPGSLSQDLLTEKNLTYTITFDMSGNPGGGPAEKSITVTAGGNSENFTYNVAAKGTTFANMQYTTYAFKFKATGSTTKLTFASTTPGSYGPVVDNLVISNVTGQICHLNNGAKGSKTLTVGASAIPAHIAHGDKAGPCESAN